MTERQPGPPPTAYSVEFYLLPGGSEFLCAMTRGFEEEELFFLARQDGKRLPAAFVVEAVRIAESELSGMS
ncbi:hypothetical protein [Streptomyces sp. HUAS ZL42]|uniref:hypothetical protein n=1 Tax=Streptomyces sp. HUAS ZL42 TaxID=3231715 RepID=UPI00345EE893